MLTISGKCDQRKGTLRSRHRVVGCGVCLSNGRDCRLGCWWRNGTIETVAEILVRAASDIAFPFRAVGPLVAVGGDAAFKIRRAGLRDWNCCASIALALVKELAVDKCIRASPPVIEERLGAGTANHFPSQKKRKKEDESEVKTRDRLKGSPSMFGSTYFLKPASANLSIDSDPCASEMTPSTVFFFNL